MTPQQRASTDRNAELLDSLLRADREQDVIHALQKAGYWDDPRVWRSYADDDGNFSSAGNQQRNPEAALVEKLINSVDACLMRACLERGIDPRSSDAPPTIREAVAIFYEGAQAGSVRDHQGYLAEWTPEQRTMWAREITLAVTGPRAEEGGAPSITIADAGEGQAPEQLPHTILSLNKGIKKAIHFVQGKFNMGGTGALRFCGKRNLQLVVSKRHPRIASQEGASNAWGFTVVRRDDPDENSRISIYRFLAPVGAAQSPRHGEILTVSRTSLPIFPDGQNPYGREAEWGTLLKLYEYDTRFKTHLFRRDGLQERLDLYIPGLGLPIRLHECRSYRGEARSFETTLAGLQVRLAGSGNLEQGFPDSGEIVIDGEKIAVTIYAFKRGAARSYRKSEGVLFVVNGQTHAFLPDRFFRRQDVGMGYLADSLLVLLDCSELSGRTKEELFMNSRDRLADARLARRIEEELADILSRHDVLRSLREQRRQEETASKLANEKPFEDALREILKRSPALAKLFIAGRRLSNPFAQNETTIGTEFHGKLHPTYFKFKELPYGEKLSRNCHLNQRARITLETDVVNDYFKRRANPGELQLHGELDGILVEIDHSINLHNGYAHLNIHLPANAAAGQQLALAIEVTDPTLVDSFKNYAVLSILPAQEANGGPPGKRNVRPNDDDGPKGLQSAGIAFPKVVEVCRENWAHRGMNEYSALRIVLAEASEGNPTANVYDFYVNMDNIFLQTEIKASRHKADFLRAQFKFGMVLFGLGILRESLRVNSLPDKDREEAQQAPEEIVSFTTDAVAPMLLPMLETLGSLDLDEITSSDGGFTVEDE